MMELWEVCLKEVKKLTAKSSLLFKGEVSLR